MRSPRNSIFSVIGVVCLTSLFGAGCTPDPITLTLRFPSEESLLYSESARILGFDVDPGEIDICAGLIRQIVDQTNTLEPSLDSGNVSVCVLRDGGFTFLDIGEGYRAFVGVVRAENGAVMLNGCIPPTDVAPGQSTLELDLTISEIGDYQSVIEVLGPRQCTTFDEKCTRGC